jgi:ribosomal protein L11 methyltransferase
MPWWQLKFVVDPGEAEDLSVLLEQAGAAAVTLEPAFDHAIFDEAKQQARLWEHTKVTALLSLKTNIEQLLDRLSSALAPDPLPAFDLTQLEDRDWSRAWMDHFVPMRFGEHLWVHPSWIEPPHPEALNIVLDPGMAFGTGTHPTTALCLAWLANNKRLPGAQVIDYGCGSGILALAAARLGAERVWAVVIDAIALTVTRDNMAKNGIAGAMIPITPEALGSRLVDIVIANILADPLLKLAPRFAELTRPGGQLVLSGILAEQMSECLVAYTPWFIMDPPQHVGEWALLTGTRQYN